EALLTFRAHINPFGEIEFDLDKIALTDQNSFIPDHLCSFGDFSLSGKAEDGTELFIDKLSFNSEGDLDDINLSISRCPEARFIRKLEKPTQAIRRWLKGFRSDPTRPLIQECQLGTIVIGECHYDDPNEISGFIKLEINEEKFDSVIWHEQANKLLDHVLGVMHFATGKMFKTPIIENYTGKTLEIMVLSQIAENQVSDIPVCSFIDRQSIFNTAVASFFNPPFPVNNIMSAIEWFVIDSSIYEVRLIHAFTALENIIASNLEKSENGKLILPAKDFEKKYLPILRRVVKKCVEKWSIGDSDQKKNELEKINEKLIELNRRSLKENLELLANCWSVSLQGINNNQIKAAVNARNLIVHEGSYNETDSNVKMEHFWVIREIVIRFIFTAIGYQGNYISHLGEFHTSQYPQKSL
ncbi:MAG: hypothetical protein ABL925_12150, partial [Methylococcales bacterium]